MHLQELPLILHYIYLLSGVGGVGSGSGWGAEAKSNASY